MPSAPNNESRHAFGIAALVGPPNAGKSTLLNTILGQKLAIVSPKPQTTRNQISGILTTPQAQVVLLDTPGITRKAGGLSRALMQCVWQALAQANALVLILDAATLAKKPASLEKEVTPLAAAIADARLPLIVAANKVDLVSDKRQLLPVLASIQGLWADAEIFPISAVTGQGVPELLAALTRHMPEGEAAYPEDQVSTLSVRFMAAEIIREKLFLSTRQELPYSVAVEIETWEDDDKGLTRIGAVIYAARESHKAMLIGKGGSMLKNIGQAAREDIEELLENKVFLSLWVKVRSDWPEDPGFLQQLGLGAT